MEGKEPFKSVFAADLKGLAFGGEHARLELVLATHTGNTITIVGLCNPRAICFPLFRASGH